MRSEKKIKEIVKKKYGEIALAKPAAGDSCCGPSASCCDALAGVNFSDSYDQLEGYNPEADLGLGCGLPTESSRIKPGQTVLDLGSGAGNDAFVARSLVGQQGRVIGLDFAPEMVAKAQDNARQLGFANVEFLLGDIDDMPLPDSSVDVVISNCVLNLVPDKAKTFAEIFRILKPGGHFSISDVVLRGELPQALADAAALYVGCVAGALQEAEYFDKITAAGFKELTTHKVKPITVPEPLLKSLLGPAETAAFLKGEVGIFSITVSAQKPGQAEIAPA